MISSKTSFLFVAAILGAFIPRISKAQSIDDRCSDQCITIDVYFQAVTYDNGTIIFDNNIQTLETVNSMVNEAMEVLNYEFEGSPFLFNWRNRNNISIIQKTEWSVDACNVEWKLNNQSFWCDHDKDINVYLAHEMMKGTSNVGCGSFPYYVFNFIGLKYDILPPQGNGLAFPHEVGHWLGLRHTHSTHSAVDWKDACSIVNPGDFVEDTPIQLRFVPEDHNISDYDEFSAEWDSCPDQPGQDSFWNIMNYVCPRRACFGDRGYFTEGQIQRMYEQWLLHREHNEICKDDEVLFFLYSPKQRRIFDQVLIIDENGIEVFNLGKSWLSGEGVLDMNLCLHRSTTYMIIHNYDYALSYHNPEFFFGAKTEDGK